MPRNEPNKSIDLQQGILSGFLIDISVSRVAHRVGRGLDRASTMEKEVMIFAIYALRDDAEYVILDLEPLG